MTTKETLCRWIFTRDQETREKTFFHHVDEAEARKIGGFDETWTSIRADIAFEVGPPIDMETETKTFIVHFVREQSASIEVQARSEEEAEMLADPLDITETESTESWEFDYAEAEE